MVSATLLRLLNESGGWGHFGGALFLFLGFLLPLECACPVLVLVFIEFGFPPAYWLFTGGPRVVFGVTSNAVAVFDVIKQLPLEFTGNQFAVDSGRKVGTLKAGRQR
jgi:hypothetical protein